MIDQSLALRIKQCRARGKTYDEISHALHVSYSTISKALREAGSTALQRSTDYRAPLSHNKSFIYDEDTTLPSYPSSLEGGEEGMDSDTSINKKATTLVAGSGGLYLVPMDNPGPSSNSQLMNAPLPSWFWKLFFVFIGIVIFIRILKKMRGDAFENE